MNLQQLLDSADIDPDNREARTYLEGIEEGAKACSLMTSDKQNGYNFEKYTQIRDTYLTCVYNTSPTDWQRGYADGFDVVAEYAQRTNPERWTNSDDD